MLEAFISKSILHVYQNVRWNNFKNLKIIQNVLLKNYIFIPKVAPLVVYFHQNNDHYDVTFSFNQHEHKNNTMVA
jgi:hypothetical protein